MSMLISSVINDGNVRFMSNTNAGNLRFPTGINVDRSRRGKMCVQQYRDEVQKMPIFLILNRSVFNICVQYRDEVQKTPIFLILNRFVFNICSVPAKWVGAVRRKGGYG